MLGAGAARAATPAPAWQLAVTSQATNLVPEATAGTQGLLVVATNVGAAATSGPVTLTVNLPTGLASAGSDCETVGQVVTCTHEESVPPGGQILQFVPVSVEPGAAGASLRSGVTLEGGGSFAVETSVETQVGAPPPAFGFLAGDGALAAFSNQADGTAAVQAGSTPYQLTIAVGFPSKRASGGGEVTPVAAPRDLSVDLPPGLVLDPAAVPRCRETQLEAKACPPASQVGVITATTRLSEFTIERGRLYNMVPPPGSASSLGVILGGGVPFHLLGALRPGDYGLSAAAADIPARSEVFGMQLQFWGNPSDPAHDAARGGPVEPRSQPLITMPSACGPLALSSRVDSWEDPGSSVSRSARVLGLAGDPLAVEGCSALAFDPDVSVRSTTTVVDSPSGLEVALAMPQHFGPAGATTSSLRRASVTLPAGMSLNPAAAAGLAACTPAEIGLTTPPGQADPRFDGSPGSCPDASKLGTVEALTPLLKDEPEAGGDVLHPLTGSIYLAEPYRNPFGSLFAVYLSIDDPETGVVIKLPGEVEDDPATGRLTATFAELPQLPFEAFELDFFAGPRGAFRTPALCGTSASRGALAPWSGMPPTEVEDQIAVNAAPYAGDCATVSAAQPHAPRFLGGTVSPRAGRDSPFVLRLSRGDGSQEIGALHVTLPAGLSGAIAGIRHCPDGALALASEKTGSEEEADPSCPAASRVGRVAVELGAGVTPYEAEGAVYLAGSYRGAPLSLAVVTPAVAGPFDLGTVVVRAAVFVDPTTGQISADSGALPTKLGGVPLDLRSIALELTRPGLIRNPTSCKPMAIAGTATTTLGQTAALSQRFQVGDCAALPFKPKAALRFSGSLRRNGHPAVHAVLRGGSDEASISSAGFSLPQGELLDLRHLRSLCTQGTAPDRCPGSSRLGRLRLASPLFDQPAEGSVYLVAPSHRLPELLAEVRAGDLRFVLHGHTVTRAGRFGISFPAIPDIPLSRAVLSLAGGRRGLLVNSHSLCSGAGKAEVRLGAHSGRRRQLRLRPRLAGC